MTQEEMQKQIESMMPTPKQVVKNIDKKLEEKRLKIMELIDKASVVAEIRRMIKNSEQYIKYHRDNNDKLCYSFKHQRLAMCELLSFLDTLEVKEVDSNDAFIEKAWDWIEDNILSSNQQDKSRLYFEQFKNYIEGE